MEGIKITDQNLFAEEDIDTLKNKIHSVFYSEGDVNLEERQNTLEGSSTLNSYEVDFYPQGEGTRIQVKYGLTTLGLILGILFLFLGVIIGAIILLFWYMKMDGVKSALDKAFPHYNVPSQQSYAQQPQQQSQPQPDEPPEKDPDDQITPPPPED